MKSPSADNDGASVQAVVSNISERCLVLGGGGVAGIAWMTGLLHGLEENGVDIACFGTVLGTSAGAAVGAQAYGGCTLGELYQRQIDPAQQVEELVPPVSLNRVLLKLLPALLVRKQPDKFRRKVGKVALKARTIPAIKRYHVIEQRLVGCQWPQKTDLKVVVVNAATGAPQVLDRLSGVRLTDAVAASCAVPGIWPVVDVDGTPYIDGGIRSGNNADYACGAKQVLVMAPMGYKPNFTPDAGLHREVKLLKESGADVLVLTPDGASLIAMGANPLDPDTRGPSTKAGCEQAVSATPMVMELLTSPAT